MPIKCSKSYQIYVLENSLKENNHPTVDHRQVCAQYHSCFLRNKDSRDVLC